MGCRLWARGQTLGAGSGEDSNQARGDRAKTVLLVGWFDLLDWLEKLTVGGGIWAMGQQLGAWSKERGVAAEKMNVERIRAGVRSQN